MESIFCSLSNKKGTMMIEAHNLHNDRGTYSVKITGGFDREELCKIIGRETMRSEFAYGVEMNEEQLLKLFALDPTIVRHLRRDVK